MLTTLFWLVISCLQCLRLIWTSFASTCLYFLGGNILFMNTNNVVAYSLYVLIFIYLDTVSFAVLYKTTVNYTDKISLSRTRLYVRIPRTFFSSYIKQQWTVLINFISDETESGNPEYHISRFHFNNCPEWTVGSFHIFFAFVLLLFQA